MGIRFSISCVFILYIVFSFSFCLLQTLVIRGNYLIEKKKKKNFKNSEEGICLGTWEKVECKKKFGIDSMSLTQTHKVLKYLEKNA